MARPSLRYRFTGRLDAAAVRYGDSTREDRAILPYDILGSIAHAEMLLRQGLIPPGDGRKLVRGLRALYREAERGRFRLDPEREDVHLNVELALTETIGEAGARLHTGRSRNDQVAVDLVLYLRDRLNGVELRTLRAVEALLGLAGGPAGKIVVPAATHLQDAQHVYLAQLLLVHAHRLLRDAERIESVFPSLSHSPLGAGALAGSSLPIDRRFTARLLGFDAPSGNSVDSVSNRDGSADALFALAMIALHLSSLAEELVLGSIPALGRVRLADPFVTTSSLMPHKRNPDMAELLRAEAGALIGLLAGELAVFKGLPLSYNRDLQTAKPLLFEGMSRVEQALDVAAPMLASAEFSPPAPQGRGLHATGSVELVDALVRCGVPFRGAHERVARLVAELEAAGRSFDGTSPEEFARRFPELGARGWSPPDPGEEVELRTTAGGSAWREVAQDLASCRAEAGRLRGSARRRETRWTNVRKTLLEGPLPRLGRATGAPRPVGSSRRRREGL